MKRALISPENSLGRNFFGLCIAAPLFIFAVIAKIIILPFERPQEITTTQVVLYLYEFIEGFGGDYDWDEFTSVPIANQQLESIRVRANQVNLPVDEEGLAALHLLLTEAKGLSEKEVLGNNYPMKNVEYLHLNPLSSIVDFAPQKPFAAVVIISTTVTSEWREQISKWLVDEGCLCMMAWGDECSLWDDSVDIYNLEANGWNDIPDDKSVVTTWHENEPLSDVFWNASQSNFHPPKTQLEYLLILDIADTAREEKIRNLFALSCKKI